VLAAIEAVVPPPFDRRVRYERVLAATRQVVIEHDPSTGAIACAGAIQRLLGRAPEDLLTLDAVLAQFDEPSRAALAAAFAQARTAADPIALQVRAGVFELTGEVVGDGDVVIAILRDDRHAQHAMLIGEIGDALTRTTSLHAMLQQCADMLVSHLHAALARIWTLNPETGELELAASAGLTTRLDGEHARVPLGHMRIGRVAEQGIPFLSNDALHDPGVIDKETVAREHLVAFAGHPLILDTRVIGVVALFARAPMAESILDQLASISGSLALGIERKRAAEALSRSESRLREEAQVMQTLHLVGRTLAAELDLGRLVQAISDAATVIAGAEMGALFYQVRSSDPNQRTRYTLSGTMRDHLDELVLDLPFDGMDIVRCDDVRAIDAPPHAHFPGVVSYLAVPVISRSGRVIGGLFFGHSKPGMFSERNERLVLGLASQAAIALDNAALYQEAQQLIEALERSNKDLDQFAYVTSHDLKAPLRGIQNLSQFIEEDLAKVLTDETREHLRLLRGRVSRLEQLVEGILQYSRSARLFSKPEAVSVGALAQDVWELLAPPAAARLHLDGPLPTIFTERVPLQQVLMNLISNALKYNPSPAPSVWISARELAGRWEIAVRDDGPGISPRFHDRIWVIFQTLQPRDEIESTGIGLAVVRKIIEAKGGRAWVDSDEGRGATFYFTWPREDEKR